MKVRGQDQESDLPTVPEPPALSPEPTIQSSVVQSHSRTLPTEVKHIPLIKVEALQVKFLY